MITMRDAATTNSPSHTPLPETNLQPLHNQGRKRKRITGQSGEGGTENVAIVRFTRSVERIEADALAESEAGPVYKELERSCVQYQAQDERRPRRDDDNTSTRPHNYTTRQDTIDEAENASSVRSETQQLHL